MVVPYQMWMLQRVASALEACTASAAGRNAIGSLLSGFEAGEELLDLDTLLAGCRTRKVGARLYSDAAG